MSEKFSYRNDTISEFPLVHTAVMEGARKNRMPPQSVTVSKKTFEKLKKDNEANNGNEE